MYKVLIVDDENKARALTEEIIKEIVADVECCQADNPFTALEMLESEIFDILFIDIVMPGINGLEVIEKVMNMPHVPYIVIVSAYKDFEYAQQGINLGASGYLVKPLCKEFFAPVMNKFEDYYNELNIRNQLLSSASNNKISFDSPIGVHIVNIHDIVMFIKTERSRFDVYTASKKINHVKGTISNYVELLPPTFIFANRRCIVNLEAIRGFNNKSKIITVQSNNKDIDVVCSKLGMVKIVKMVGERK